MTHSLGKQPPRIQSIVGSCRVEAVLETAKQLEQRESGLFQIISTKPYYAEGLADVIS